MSGPKSLEALQWLQLYRKLSDKRSSGLTEAEQKLLEETEKKIAQFIEPGALGGPPRREHLRVSHRFEIAVKTPNEMKRLFIKNISGGGMYIETAQPAKVGDKFDLYMTLPGVSGMLNTIVEVAWSNPRGVGDLGPGMGVRFVNLSEKEKKTIREIVAKAVEEEIKKKS